MKNMIIPAVFVIFRREQKILVGRRLGVWGSGLLCFPGGHVEAGESFKMAAVREMKEEVGLDILAQSLIPFHIMSRRNEKGQERIDVYFAIDSWVGEPINNEPEKCSELLWVPVDDLPKDLVSILVDALSFSSQGIFYSENW